MPASLSRFETIERALADLADEETLCGWTATAWRMKLATPS